MYGVSNDHDADVQPHNIPLYMVYLTGGYHNLVMEVEERGGSGSPKVAGVCWVEIAPEPQTRKSPCEPPDWQSGRLGVGTSKKAGAQDH